ncbi:MAG: choice-of-anchor Q domain-containing protein [Dokdonella sp.]
MMNSALKSPGLIVFAILAWSFSAACHAAPPNDDWAHRTVIAALPYSDSLPNVEQATTESSDPELFCVGLGHATAGANSVWYEYTTGAADEFVTLQSGGYDTIIGVYEGSPSDGLIVDRGGCNDDGAGSAAGSAIKGLRLRANTRYSIVIARYPPNTAASMTLAFSMSSSPVYQVTDTVNTSDGVCDAQCSLRDAIQQSTAQPGAILVPAGHYVVSGGLILGSTGGAIYGAGMTQTVIDAAGAGRVMTHGQFLANHTYALHDLTLTHGSSSSGGAFYGSGGHYVMDHVAMTDSVSSTDGGGAFFEETSTLSMYDSLITGNHANRSGGGLDVVGDNMEIHESSITNNESATVAAKQGGGGLFTLSRNEVRLFNVTISGNHAAGIGGGAYLSLDGQGLRTKINNISIVDNDFGAAPASALRGGLMMDLQVSSSQPFVFTNSVIAGNHASFDPDALSDCAAVGTFVFITGNDAVQVPNSCNFSAAGDQTGIDPLLLPLTSVGLPAHVPAAASPLVDAGDPATCERSDALGTQRPLDGDGDGDAVCDIGAVERPAIDTDRIFANGFD